MLDFETLSNLPNGIEAAAQQLQLELIESAARHIANAAGLTVSAEYELARAFAIGAHRDEVLDGLAKFLETTTAEIVKMLAQSSNEQIAGDMQTFVNAGFSPVQLAESPYLQQLVDAMAKKVGVDFRNLTKTTVATHQRQFIRAMDTAHNKITTGAFTYQRAIRSAVSELSQQGVQAVTYRGVNAKGIKYTRTDNIVVASRRAALTGMVQTAAEVAGGQMDLYDCYYVECSAHGGARPSHAAVQGKVYFWARGRQVDNIYQYPELVAATGYGTAAGIGGVNCRHLLFPYYPGQAKTYSRAQLRDYNEAKYTYNDAKLTEYQASEIQRGLERGVRRWKTESAAMTAAGEDNAFAAAKVREWQARLRDFVDQTGMRRDYFREYVA